MKNQEKIIEILALISTGQRDDSIRNYIEYVLYKSEKVSSSAEIIAKTNDEFGLILQQGEVDTEIDWLVDNGRAIREGGLLCLTPKAKDYINASVDKHEKIEKEQFGIFKREIQNINRGKVSESDVESIFKCFQEYLYDSFLEYGREATNLFNPSGSGSESAGLSNNTFLKKALLKLPKAEHKTLLEQYALLFPSIITVKQLDYLEMLANKAESFFALGLSKELYNELQSIAPLDWTFYVDTNILYSILNLRSHVENNAIKDILEINKKFSEIFALQFRYLPITHRELKLLRKDLASDVLKIDLNQKQIVAALDSGKLDDFTKSYYENMLKYGANTQHPVSIVDQSINILKSLGVKLYNRELFDTEDEETVEFKEKLSAYNTYQQIRNEARSEKGLEPRLPKSYDRVVHDVTLREMVLFLRQNASFESPVNVSDCKIYGLTIDKGLLDFDRHELRKHFRAVSGFVPTFFLPSFLLKRMYQYLPVQSEDYRKSFLLAISSPLTASKDKDSSIVQKTLAHFRALGIDNNEFIISSLTSDLFLQNISRFADDSEKIDDFIESEINKTIDLKNKEIEKNNKALKIVEGKLKSTTTHSSKVSNENSELKSDNETLEQNIKALTANLGKLQSEIKKGRKNKQTEQVQGVLPFPDEKDVKIKDLQQLVDKLDASNKSAADEMKKALERSRRAYRKEVTAKWQRKPLINFYWLLGSVIFVIIISYLWVMLRGNLSFSGTFIAIVKAFESKVLAWVGTCILGIITFIAGGVFIKEYLSRREPKNYETYQNQVELPESLE